MTTTSALPTILPAITSPGALCPMVLLVLAYQQGWASYTLSLGDGGNHVFLGFLSGVALTLATLHLFRPLLREGPNTQSETGEVKDDNTTNTSVEEDDDIIILSDSSPAQESSLPASGPETWKEDQFGYRATSWFSYLSKRHLPNGSTQHFIAGDEDPGVIIAGVASAGGGDKSPRHHSRSHRMCYSPQTCSY